MNKRILLIDGNWLAHRCLFNTKLLLQTEDEQQQFAHSLMYQFIKIWEVFSPHCQDVLVVSDDYSWRKKLPTYYPYYVSEGDDSVGYKKNRAQLKEGSDINFDAYNKLFKEFTNKLSSMNRHIHIQYLEGDDILTLISAYHKDTDMEFVVLATDKDLGQIVRSNVHLFMNTSSKQHPNGYFWLSPSKFKEKFAKGDDMLSKLMESTNRDVSFDELMKIDILDTAGVVKRNADSGVMPVYRWSLILNKIVCGDKSDNILPIIRWKSKTGTVNYSVTQRHIDMVTNGGDEKSCYDIVTSDNLETFIKSLLEVTKQPSTLLEKALEHYRHNYQLVVLNKALFPQESVNLFETEYKNLQSNGLYDGITISDIKKHFGISDINANVSTNTDAAFELLKNSL